MDRVQGVEARSHRPQRHVRAARPRTRLHERGGIVSLARLIRRHADAVEADLQRYYRIDLADLWRGRLTLRRLATLLRYLPAEAATLGTYGDPAAGWTRTHYLLTDVFHAVTGKPHPARPAPPSRRRDPAEIRRRDNLLHERARRRAEELTQLQRG
ncbi:hypothetical protein E1091_00355 [Micromonospora fluostatini]|uniref:Uncharacterized protein n=1 Tax=Micromonospora fluostatini TaxID=1629071 RepID=A0ABY2DM53_9ACTN|nr:hypothetical protein E1091_00355 [Micromonospora fluostatini]